MSIPLHIGQFILFSGTDFDEFPGVTAVATQVGAGAVIDLGGGESITIENTHIGDFHADDFMFSFSDIKFYIE